MVKAGYGPRGGRWRVEAAHIKGICYSRRVPVRLINPPAVNSNLRWSTLPLFKKNSDLVDRALIVFRCPVLLNTSGAGLARES